ncbi:hypothetical protein CC86DRAFT_420044 [Ophiobolus disseminans]|uniref:Transcription factor domain-containing protein n=1 Tax=Ophiobolus disseminans TaxID=1469910 RepID=A0A6A6ZVG3_9PLEO|nr:hypothetical protein CC86DRAFT_420044 [Ophiobolus disseminans]
MGLREVCLQHKDGTSLAKRFVILAHTLEHANAVALPVDHNAGNLKASCTLQEAWNDTLQGELAYGGTLLINQSGVLRHSITQAGVIHPLTVAILAFRLGGPVNAANSAYAQQWRLSERPVPAGQVKKFHMEGESRNIFDEQRVAFVWEVRDGQVCSTSDDHSIFLGDSIPHELKRASSIGNAGVVELSAIIYDSRNASLVYECQDAKAVRHSISLDFHVHDTPDDMLSLPADMKQQEFEPKGRTLMELLTCCPGPGYSSHSHCSLFSPDSLTAIVDKLSRINVPQPTLPSDPQPQFFQQMERCKLENQCHIPPDILRMGHDIFISGTYLTTAMFIHNVVFKARRDVHLHLGWDLVPQNRIEEECDSARKFIRDISAMLMQEMANSIGRWCRKLCATGYVSSPDVLAVLPMFTSALGLALNGPKEIQENPEPKIDGNDFQVYRTRCLYLFWCTKCLVDYLGKPLAGPFMLEQLDKRNIAAYRFRVGICAGLLQRNWVAWSMFVEGLPRGEMVVRRPVM